MSIRARRTTCWRRWAGAGALLGAVLIPGLTASPALGSAGLVGEWPLNEGSGVHVADVSGFGNNGVLSGGVTWTASGSGYALSFDGVTGRARVPDSPSLSPTSAVTVSAWVKHAGSPGDYRYVVAKGATGCIAASYGLYTGPNGGLQFYVSEHRGTTFARSGDDGLGVWDGRWHLIVGTFDGTTIRLFVDGAEVGSGVTYPGALDYALPDSNDLYIGDYTGCRQHEFLGLIDDVMIWNRALTPPEVKELVPPADGGSVSPPASPSGPGSARGGGAPSAADPGGGGGSPSVTGATSPGTSGSPSPALTGLRFSGTSLVVGTDGQLSRVGHHTALTITYTDRQGARVTVAVMRIETGRRVGGRCLAPSHTSIGHIGICTRSVVIGQFTHTDLPGRTTLRFTGLPGRRLVPGRYRLIVTPRRGGRTGVPVTIGFSVRRAG